MVMPGQFLERPTLINLGDFCLEALWHRGDRRPALLILCPHPRFGGSSMDAPLCLEMAFAASRLGMPTLRFNWRGVCASQGEMGGLTESLEDAQEALAALRANVSHSEIVIAGHGFGAAIACELARVEPSILGAILVAPTGAELNASALADLPCEIRLVLPGATDQSFEDVTALSAPHLRVEVVPEADAGFVEALSQAGEAVARLARSLGGELDESASP